MIIHVYSNIIRPLMIQVNYLSWHSKHHWLMTSCGKPMHMLKKIRCCFGLHLVDDEKKNIFCDPKLTCDDGSKPIIPIVLPYDLKEQTSRTIH